jgi:uncharacterized protein YebE (UPF0316 family)
MNSQTFFQIIIPLLIFFARILDVSLGTIRIIYVSRGIRILAPLLGFVEVFIWLLALSQIMKNLTNIANYFAYAAGFAAGNFIGISLEKKISMGKFLVRVITRDEGSSLASMLSEQGFGITSVKAQGSTGPVKLIFTVIKRKDIARVLDIIKQDGPQAFYTIEDVRYVTENIPSLRGFSYHFRSFLLKKK